MVSKVADKSLEQQQIEFSGENEPGLITELSQELGMSPQEPAVDALDLSLRELFEEEDSAVYPYQKALLDRLGHTDVRDLANQLTGLVNMIRAGRAG